MNKIKTQSGKTVIAVGQENSYARLKDQYDVTLPKLIAHIKSKNEASGLIKICEEDNLTNRQISSQLVNAAYFYAKQFSD
jgi:hypothetical protein